MEIKIYPLGMLAVNTLLVFDEDSREAFIVDPAGELDDIISEVDRKELKIKYIINTHEHPDHTAKNAWAKLTFPEAKLVMHPETAKTVNMWIESDFGKSIGAEYSPEPDLKVNEGDVLSIGNKEFKIFHTPGHSPGSICIYNPESNFVIVGDLIFKGSIGRYDLPGSNYEELKQSIIKLLSNVEKDTTIIPGHGPTTTVEEELLDNPFIREIVS
ncbi:MBL fold metallo-hydrolase [Desulfurobacterium atlanticum]|uniref:Glyoxylase, beta-lactamase superfamily II n=1 Tax=Desulfurobacterium atlanticum TaxID=240169 RepID=A0A238ZMD0_9BACT|nr:MBL fold metallo-hydrolase [Desulfurobacterium atlanticum]SNR84565.1 Glyoxylase, beta-lactamase superfamily II [Desulfurobacterium atlanticum]